MSNTRGRAPASPGLFRPSKSILRWAGTPGLLLLMLGLVAVLSGVHGVCAQKDPALHLYELISQARLYEGLAPLGRSTLLNQAAQRHADDLVSLGKVTHEGSDGSSFQQRIREVRYHAWEDGLLVDEVIWAGLGTAEDALVWLHSNPSWKVLTDPRYREIGVGYADDNGVHYFVITVGSRPGVLPIFINDGAETTDTAQVALHLTNEEAVPLGEGNWMGRAIEVRISNQPDFEGLPWLPWEPLLPWVLAGDQPGEYAVYVEFRDGANRTAVSQDTIRLVTPQEMPPTPTPFFTLLKATPVALATLPPVTPTAVPGERLRPRLGHRNRRKPLPLPPGHQVGACPRLQRYRPTLPGHRYPNRAAFTPPSGPLTGLWCWLSCCKGPLCCWEWRSSCASVDVSGIVALSFLRLCCVRYLVFPLALL